MPDKHLICSKISDIIYNDIEETFWPTYRLFGITPIVNRAKRTEIAPGFIVIQNNYKHLWVILCSKSLCTHQQNPKWIDFRWIFCSWIYVFQVFLPKVSWSNILKAAYAIQLLRHFTVKLLTSVSSAVILNTDKNACMPPSTYITKYLKNIERHTAHTIVSWYE